MRNPFRKTEPPTPWQRKQEAAQTTGARYYGDGGTIHHTLRLNIEQDHTGEIVSVWFRCQPLPFDVDRHPAGSSRPDEMRRMYAESWIPELTGVEVSDGT